MAPIFSIPISKVDALLTSTLLQLLLFMAETTSSAKCTDNGIADDCEISFILDIAGFRLGGGISCRLETATDDEGAPFLFAEIGTEVEEINEVTSFEDDAVRVKTCMLF